ncbi:hypothetical protein GDO81_002982 [Engystomops pustulosus]|uniref:Uncharacterized protein n=1 Tax=Engystomops pustulosus TaxID=76066 RepID=A0AAV7DQ17_ENGPU|nr:hypothetical protein GDO81_002982 [Engystomops pustulosus]
MGSGIGGLCMMENPIDGKRQARQTLKGLSRNYYSWSSRKIKYQRSAVDPCMQPEAVSSMFRLEYGSFCPLMGTMFQIIPSLSPMFMENLESSDKRNSPRVRGRAQTRAQYS